MPQIDHHLKLATQTILTYGSWVFTAVVGAFAEPLGSR
jgi:hypothetical protein